MDIVSVTCNSTIDPPQIVITFAGQIPFQVSTAVYEYLRTLIPELPENPCAPE